MEDQKKLMVKMALDAWTSHISRTDNLLSSLTDEDLQKEVAPGRNSGVYLLGHLAAVHDKMLPLLGLGEQAYPHLDDIFLTSPDKSLKEKPATGELRAYWKEANTKIANLFSSVSPDEWFQKHTAVSEEDFKKEPHRNRLNVLIGRTNHLAYHFGQLAFLKK